MKVTDSRHQIQIINASHWQKAFYKSFAVYSPHLDFLNFIKQQLIHASEFDIQLLKLNLKDFHAPFACCLINQETNEFFLMRDHFGQEPFYYQVLANNSKQLCFGSTLPDILEHVDNPKQNKSLISEVLTDVYTCGMEYSDDTFFQNIFRVTPGHIISLHMNKQVRKHKHPYWLLEPGKERLNYTSDKEYDEQFAFLLKEAIQFCCKESSRETDIALEYSGGLDTAALLTTLNTEGLPAQLFMHADTEKPCEERAYGEKLRHELKSNYPLHYINAENFDPIQVLDTCKSWFGGGAPYLFFMLANNIHTAVKQSGCKTLLSGFGGDECVSSHAPLRTYAAEIGFKKFWAMFQSENKHHHAREHIQALLRAQPHAWYGLQHLKAMFSGVSQKSIAVRCKPYRSLQHREQDWLQGKHSYHLRMRVEYSAVVARKMGFRYQYPLLYPPLVEFCFLLPVEQKRRYNQNRLLMKRYLNKQVPSGLFNAHQKCGNILPATFDMCQKNYQSGHFDTVFGDLPYAQAHEKLRRQGLPEERLFHVDFLRYMFKD